MLSIRFNILDSSVIIRLEMKYKLVDRVLILLLVISLLKKVNISSYAEDTVVSRKLNN